MAVLIVTPEAEDDIDAIVYRIAADQPEAAIKWLDRLNERMQTLADWPGMGVARDELRVGLRGYPLGNYMIFYRSTGDGVAVVRVLDGRRDLRSIFLQ